MRSRMHLGVLFDEEFKYELAFNILVLLSLSFD